LDWRRFGGFALTPWLLAPYTFLFHANPRATAEHDDGAWRQRADDGWRTLLYVSGVPWMTGVYDQRPATHPRPPVDPNEAAFKELDDAGRLVAACFTYAERHGPEGPSGGR